MLSEESGPIAIAPGDKINVLLGCHLTYMPRSCILMHMRTTLNLDEDMIKRASELTGVKEKTSLVRLGLEALIARESSRRLAELGGTERGLQRIPRRKSAGK